MAATNDVVTLREYVEALMDKQNKAVDAALVAADKAVTAALTAANTATDKAEANAQKWRENANEWRGTMNDRETKFVQTGAYDEAMRAVRSDIASLRDDIATVRSVLTGALAERKGGVDMRAAMLALAGFAVIVISFWLSTHGG